MGFKVTSLQRGPPKLRIEPGPPAWLTKHKENVAKFDVYSEAKSDLIFGKNFTCLKVWAKTR